MNQHDYEMKLLRAKAMPKLDGFDRVTSEYKPTGWLKVRVRRLLMRLFR